MKENLTELVAVRLFKDNDKYNSDVFVSVNCNNYLIRRGETVMVPLFRKTCCWAGSSPKWCRCRLAVDGALPVALARGL